MDVPVELSRILITELGDQQVIFLREKDGERNFPILIGISEAMAIDRRLKGMQTPRPMTHDLLGSVIKEMGGEVQKVVISDLHEHTFIAKLFISLDGEMIEIDSRPSDAIALGVGLDVPFYVAEHVFDTVMATPSQNDRIELLKKRMELLAGQISLLSDQLGDNDYLTNTPEEVLQEHRTKLNEMQTEYEAIERVLKKVE